MGALRKDFIRVEAFVGNVERTSGKDLSFSVDTRNFYTVIQPFVAEELGIEPYAKRSQFWTNS